MNQIQHPNPRKPTWGWLYFWVALLLVVFWFEARLTLSENGHRIAEVAILLVGYSLISGWVKGNEIAMMYEEHARQRAEWKKRLEPASQPEGSIAPQNKPQAALPWLLAAISTAIEFFRG